MKVFGILLTATLISRCSMSEEVLKGENHKTEDQVRVYLDDHKLSKTNDRNIRDIQATETGDMEERQEAFYIPAVTRTSENVPIIAYVAAQPVDLQPGFFSVALNCIKYWAGQIFALIISAALTLAFCIHTGFCHRKIEFARNFREVQSYLNADNLTYATKMLSKALKTYSELKNVKSQ